MACPRPISIDFISEIEWKSIRFCSGLAQNKFLWFLTKFEIKINQILLWAGPDQVPLSFYWNLNENHSDSADTFVYVWFDCLVCVRFSSANMNRYDCLGLVWLIGLLFFFQWNLSSTIKRRFTFQCQTRFVLVALYSWRLIRCNARSQRGSWVLAKPRAHSQACVAQGACQGRAFII